MGFDNSSRDSKLLGFVSEDVFKNGILKVDSILNLIRLVGFVIFIDSLRNNIKEMKRSWGGSLGL